MDIAAIQAALAEQDIDGWLLYDFRGSNPIARSVIGFDDQPDRHAALVLPDPAKGEPVAILHVIEPNALKHAPGTTVLYRSWRELEGAPPPARGRHGAVAMEYSPGAAIPYVAPRGRGHRRDGRGRGRRGGELGRPRADCSSRAGRRSRRALHDRAARSCTAGQGRGLRPHPRALATGRAVKESEVQAFIRAPVRGARPLGAPSRASWP